MAEKTCKSCNRVYEGDKCPGCGSQEYTEEIKGRIIILDPENSEIAKKIKISKPGSYAIKSR
jgi:DNA-directed RNA polymerase subunit E"